MSEADPSILRRGPGRPRQTDEEMARVRAQILAATETALAEHGFRDVTVMRIIANAGITRPNFYRYYRNAGEPVQIVLERVGDDLLDEVTARVEEAVTAPDKVAAGIDAYLAWSRRYRHLMPVLYTDLHDSGSPVAEIRRRCLDRLMVLIADKFPATGRPLPPRDAIDIFVNAVEYTCHKLFLNPAGTPDEQTDVDEARWMMLRIAMATLGYAKSWQFLAEHSDLGGI